MADIVNGQIPLIPARWWTVEEIRALTRLSAHFTGVTRTNATPEVPATWECRFALGNGRSSLHASTTAGAGRPLRGAAQSLAAGDLTLTSHPAADGATGYLLHACVGGDLRVVELVLAAPKTSECRPLPDMDPANVLISLYRILWPE